MAEELVLDMGPEWRAFDEEERQRRSRVGAAVTPRLHDWGVGTKFYGVDERTRKIARLHSRLRKENSVNVVKTLQFLNRICNNMRLPSHICDEAALLARRMARVYDLRGALLQTRYSEMMAAAAVLAAAARNGISLGNEIAGYHARDLMHMLWSKGIVYKRDIGTTVSRIISSAADQLGLHRAVPDAIRIFHVYRPNMGGLAPKSIAAAVLYVAAKINDIPVSQERVAKAIGLTDASVRNATRKMKIRVVYEIYDGDKLFYRDEWHTGARSYGLLTPSEMLVRLGYQKKPYEKRIGDPVKVVIRL